MAERIVVDMTKAKTYRKPRKKKASVLRDKERYWDSRYSKFIAAGFTDDESKWGADHGLSTRSKQVKAVIKHRKFLVFNYLIGELHMSKADAIEEASRDLQSKLEKAGIQEDNLFYEISP
jgi:hypothetical protein